MRKVVTQLCDLRETEKDIGRKLEEQRAHASHLALFFDEYLEVLIDDGDGEEDSGSGPDDTHEVGQNGQGADTETAERSRRRNVAEEMKDMRVKNVGSDFLSHARQFH